ncbi:aldo/keto reductase family protein [Caldibacillus thermoamylovorans]
MRYRQLGNTDLRVSELSFGTWAIGGSWGKVDDQESLRALVHAIDRSVNFFDTADVYGNGHSEELLAKAALRWVLDHEEVTCAIPGFKTVKQVEENLAALAVPSFSEEEMARLRQFYETDVHPHIRGAY